ncbi:MAG: SoxY-related AACIE arm protein [Alphaproteobacteria bacterium]
MPEIPPRQPSRRVFLRGTAALAAAAAWPRAAAHATPETMRQAIRTVLGEAEARPGKVTLDIPALVENGNAVPLSVLVESPMTAADHVKAIHIFNEKNPQPHVISGALGPRAGRARMATRIKLADSQRVIALAQMSDGSFWTGAADVIVTLAACVEDLQ